MLHVTIQAVERYDDINNEFLEAKKYHLQLEHSLVSISKWESKWHKPFLGSDTRTDDETIDYIRCMTLTQNVEPEAYYAMSPLVIQQISDYINDSMTATWFVDDNKKGKGGGKEIVTSELIYYWMISLNIPVEFQKWHLNRLITLIKVCNLKNTPPKKMSRRETISRNKALNEQRRREMNSRG